MRRTRLAPPPPFVVAGAPDACHHRARARCRPAQPPSPPIGISRAWDGGGEAPPEPPRRREGLNEQLYFACLGPKAGDPQRTLRRVARLVEAGADPNWRHPTTGSTPVHVAIGHLGRGDTVVRWLVEFGGFSLLAKDRRGRTALDAAVASRRWALATYLKQRLMLISEEERARMAAAAASLQRVQRMTTTAASHAVPLTAEQIHMRRAKRAQEVVRLEEREARELEQRRAAYDAVARPAARSAATVSPEDKPSAPTARTRAAQGAQGRHAQGAQGGGSHVAQRMDVNGGRDVRARRSRSTGRSKSGKANLRHAPDVGSARTAEDIAEVADGQAMVFRDDMNQVAYVPAESSDMLRIASTLPPGATAARLPPSPRAARLLVGPRAAEVAAERGEGGEGGAVRNDGIGGGIPSDGRRDDGAFSPGVVGDKEVLPSPRMPSAASSTVHSHRPVPRRGAAPPRPPPPTPVGTFTPAASQPTSPVVRQALRAATKAYRHAGDAAAESAAAAGDSVPHQRDVKSGHVHVLATGAKRSNRGTRASLRGSYLRDPAPPPPSPAAEAVPEAGGPQLATGARYANSAPPPDVLQLGVGVRLRLDALGAAASDGSVGTHSRGATGTNTPADGGVDGVTSPEYATSGVVTGASSPVAARSSRPAATTEAPAENGDALYLRRRPELASHLEERQQLAEHANDLAEAAATLAAVEVERRRAAQLVQARLSVAARAGVTAVDGHSSSTATAANAGTTDDTMADRLLDSFTEMTRALTKQTLAEIAALRASPRAVSPGRKVPQSPLIPASGAGRAHERITRPRAVSAESGAAVQGSVDGGESSSSLQHARRNSDETEESPPDAPAVADGGQPPAGPRQGDANVLATTSAFASDAAIQYAAALLGREESDQAARDAAREIRRRTREAERTVRRELEQHAQRRDRRPRSRSRRRSSGDYVHRRSSRNGAHRSRRHKSRSRSRRHRDASRWHGRNDRHDRHDRHRRRRSSPHHHQRRYGSRSRTRHKSRSQRGRRSRRGASRHSNRGSTSSTRSTGYSGGDTAGTGSSRDRGGTRVARAPAAAAGTKPGSPAANLNALIETLRPAFAAAK